MRPHRTRLIATFVALTAILATHPVAHADHAFDDGRHWNKTTITFIDSTTSEWDAVVQSAVDNWNEGLNQIEIKLVEGQSGKKLRKSCPFVRGKVRLCNSPYGFPALAQAEVSINSSDHIKKGRIRFDDTDFGFGSLPAVCHESGHILGLDHRPQNNQNTTCMTPALVTGLPDAHDLASIDALHAHLH